MATWGEMRKFTHGELKQFTYDQLNRLTIDELIAIANSRIEAISKKDSELAAKLGGILKTITLNVASSAIYDAAQEIDWLDILKQFVLFVQNL